MGLIAGCGCFRVLRVILAGWLFLTIWLENGCVKTQSYNGFFVYPVLRAGYFLCSERGRLCALFLRKHGIGSLIS